MCKNSLYIAKKGLNRVTIAPDANMCMNQPNDHRHIGKHILIVLCIDTADLLCIVVIRPPQVELLPTM